MKSLVALAALVLTAYLARLNLQHQRLEAHRGRVWERQVDIVPEFLEWLETDAADGRPQVDSSDPVDHDPRMPVALHARLTAFLPELSEELAKGLLAVGEWRHALALYHEDKASPAHVEHTATEAGRHLEYIRLLAKNEERLSPYTAETIRPHLVAALRNRKAE